MLSLIICDLNGRQHIVMHALSFSGELRIISFNVCVNVFRGITILAWLAIRLYSVPGYRIPVVDPVFFWALPCRLFAPDWTARPTSIGTVARRINALIGDVFPLLPAPSHLSTCFPSPTRPR